MIARKKALSGMGWIVGCLVLSQIVYAQAPTMFRGGPAHTGVYEGTGPKTKATVKWEFKTEGRVISSPAIADGLVFIGSADQNMYAVKQDDGSLKWKFPTEGLISSSPAVQDGILYFGSYDGNFYAVDISTGKEKWHFTTGGERRFAAKHIHGAEPASQTMPDTWDFYLSSPVIWNSAVYFGSGDGNVYALNIANGTLKWKYQTGDVVHASPALDAGLVLIGSFDKYFYALDAATGKLRWRHKTGEDPDIHNQEGITSSAAVINGVVYFGCRNATVYALDEKSGNELWTHKGDRGWVTTSPAVLDGKVYYATGSDLIFGVLDAKTGQVLFSKKIGAGVFSSPAIGGGTLYLATFGSAAVRAFDLGTYQDTTIFSTPKLEDAATGAPRQTAETRFYDDIVAAIMGRLDGGVFLSSPVVANGVVYIGSTNGSLYALE